MFDFLGPIGAIKSPQGSLKFGHVGATDCVYLSYESEADFVPTLIYSADELAELIAIVEVAAVEMKTLAQGSSQRIGSMRAKPIALRLVLVHPPAQPPFLLLRLSQGNWAQDITSSPEALLTLLRMGQVEGPEPLLGPLERNGSGSWSVAGEQLEILQGLSPGQGYFGEYLHPDEVKAGEVVEVWPFSLEGQKFIACFRLKERYSPARSGDEHRGERADRYLARGQNHLARAEVLKLGEELLSSGKVPAPWAAKASLTHLLADLADGDDTSGHRVWLGQSGNKFLNLGIEFLEAGQTSFHDLLIYQQVSAYFHSLNPDVSSAEVGVNNLMSKLCDECSKSAPRLTRMALSNWYLYLKEIYEAEPTPDALVDWNKAVVSSGLTVNPKVISFPHPDSWVVVEELLSNPKAAPHSVQPETFVQANKFKLHALAVMLVLLLTLALVKLSFPPASNLSNSQFQGDTAFSISGISLDQTWEEMDELRDWEDRQTTILSTYLDDGFLTVRFAADKTVKYIEGPELSKDGRVLFTHGRKRLYILSRWGEPSEFEAGRDMVYVYDDAGVKCVLSFKFDQESHLERVRLSKAGNRWEKTPSLPILER